MRYNSISRVNSEIRREKIQYIVMYGIYWRKKTTRKSRFLAEVNIIVHGAYLSCFHSRDSRVCT